MTSFTDADDLAGARFTDVDLSDARFVRSNLSGVTMRAVAVDDLDIDDPWIGTGEVRVIVNGVDIAPLVEAELDRRFPGRALCRATEPAGLREAWTAVERAWAGAVERVAAMPAGMTDASVDGEWSFAQTVRHLVMATDTWLGRGIDDLDFSCQHPIGVPNAEYESDGYDTSLFSAAAPTFAEVLEVRADRQGRVREFIAHATAALLDEPRRHPWGPEHRVTVRHCLQTILAEEWEHLRYALRDLDALEQGSARRDTEPPAGEDAPR